MIQGLSRIQISAENRQNALNVVASVMVASVAILVVAKLAQNYPSPISQPTIDQMFHLGGRAVLRCGLSWVAIKTLTREQEKKMFRNPNYAFYSGHGTGSEPVPYSEEVR